VRAEGAHRDERLRLVVNHEFTAAAEQVDDHVARCTLLNKGCSAMPNSNALSLGSVDATQSVGESASIVWAPIRKIFSFDNVFSIIATRLLNLPSKPFDNAANPNISLPLELSEREGKKT